MLPLEPLAEEAEEDGAVIAEEVLEASALIDGDNNEGEDEGEGEGDDDDDDEGDDDGPSAGGGELRGFSMACCMGWMTTDQSSITLPSSSTS